MNLQLITSEVLKLDRLERIELIRILAESVVIEERMGNVAAEEPELTSEQAEEIHRRLARFDAGESEAIPGETVHAELAKKQ